MAYYLVLLGVMILLRSSLSDSATVGLLGEQIMVALETMRGAMTNPAGHDMDLPTLDPLFLPDVSGINKDIRVPGKMTMLTLSQLSGFSVNKVSSNIILLKAFVFLGLPVLRLNGVYVPVELSSEEKTSFSFDARNLVVNIGIDFELSANESLKVSKLIIEKDITGIEFKNVMSVDNNEELEKELQNVLHSIILQALDDYCIPRFKEALIHQINFILRGKTKDGGRELKDEAVNDYFDRIFADTRRAVINKNLDPINLPADSDNFTITLFNTTMDGYVSFDKGHVFGLSTIHRAGNMSLDVIGINGEVVWGGNIALIDLAVDYTFTLDYAFLGSAVDLTFTISFLSVDFVTNVFLLQSDVVFESCNVTDIGPVHFKETAGIVDQGLYNLIANALLATLTTLVAQGVEGVVCPLLELAIAGTG